MDNRHLCVPDAMDVEERHFPQSIGFGGDSRKPRSLPLREDNVVVFPFWTCPKRLHSSLLFSWLRVRIYLSHLIARSG